MSHLSWKTAVKRARKEEREMACIAKRTRIHHLNTSSIIRTLGSVSTNTSFLEELQRSLSFCQYEQNAFMSLNQLFVATTFVYSKFTIRYKFSLYFFNPWSLNIDHILYLIKKKSKNYFLTTILIHQSRVSSNACGISTKELRLKYGERLQDRKDKCDWLSFRIRWFSGQSWMRFDFPKGIKAQREETHRSPGISRVSRTENREHS